MNNWKSALLLIASKYKENKYTCTKFLSAKYPTNKISSVNFSNYKKHLSQTNKPFRTTFNFSFLKLCFFCIYMSINTKNCVVWIWILSLSLNLKNGWFFFSSIIISTTGSQWLNIIFSQLVFYLYFLMLGFNNKRNNQKILINVLGFLLVF